MGEASSSWGAASATRLEAPSANTTPEAKVTAKRTGEMLGKVLREIDDGLLGILRLRELMTVGVEMKLEMGMGDPP
jgi:hypothetical protein